MCFHNSMSKKAQALAARYGRKTDIVEIYEDILREKYGLEEKPDINNLYLARAFSKKVSPYPIITTDEDIQVFEWGMFASFVKHKIYAEKSIYEGIIDARKHNFGIYNANADTIFEKPTFKDAIIRRRCIIPSTGYFEYHHPDPKTAIPYYIFLPNEEIFSMAGIYDEWKINDKESVCTFSMITTEANEFTREIHNGGKHPFRMPLILEKEDESKWLNPDLTQNEIQALLKPYPAELMDAYPIDKELFQKGNPYDKHIIEKVV